jgi:hypothetical protein
MFYLWSDFFEWLTSPLSQKVNESVELAWSDLNVVERQDPEYFNYMKKFFFLIIHFINIYSFFIANFNHCRIN